MPILRIVLAIFLPPLAVFLTRGLGRAFWISVLLTIIGFVPGAAYALFVVLSDRRALA